MTTTPEDEKKKAGEKVSIIERRRDKNGVVFDRAIREIEPPPEDNITPFKEALQKLSKEVARVSEELEEPTKEFSEKATKISAALEEITKTIPEAMEQISALTSEITASEEFKKAGEIAALEIHFRNRELRKVFYKEYLFQKYKRMHPEEFNKERIFQEYKKEHPEEFKDISNEEEAKKEKDIVKEKEKELRKIHYREPSWEEVLDEHIETIEAASDSAIAMATLEDGSVLMPGTMYEHYKKAWREYLSAWLEAKKTVMEAPTTHNKRIFFPIAAAFGKLFPLSNLQNSDYLTLEFNGANEEDKKDERDVITLINLDFSELPFHISKELTTFDGDIFTACLTLCLEAAKKAGGGERDLSPCITTIREVYNTLGQDVGGNQQKSFIDALDKLDRARILIDNDQEILEGYKYQNAKQNGWGHVLNVEYYPVTIQNQKGIKENVGALYITPTGLMHYIVQRGQFISVKREFFSLLEGVFNKNDRARSVRNYIIKAIHTQTKRNGSITILFETLCEKCKISRKPKDNQEKRTTENIIKPILQTYKAAGLIQDFQIKEKDKITIQVDPAPKLEAKKKPPKRKPPKE